MPEWLVGCTKRALRVFRLEDSHQSYDGRPVKKSIKDLKCVRFAISKSLIKLQQINSQIILLCFDRVNILKVTEDDAQIVHSVEYNRSERIGIFPGFDYDNFPFIMRQHYKSADPCAKTCKGGDYTEWQSHHLRIT